MLPPGRSRSSSWCCAARRKNHAQRLTRNWSDRDAFGRRRDAEGVASARLHRPASLHRGARTVGGSSGALCACPPERGSDGSRGIGAIERPASFSAWLLAAPSAGRSM